MCYLHTKSDQLLQARHQRELKYCIVNAAQLYSQGQAVSQAVCSRQLLCIMH